MYRSKNVKQGLRRVELDIGKLLDKDKFKRFDSLWNEFYKSDPLNPKVIQRKGQKISYLCDYHVPSKTDKRRSILLLFGNSTPHSIVGNLYFAWEGNKKEHRMWRLLEEFRLLRFDFKNKSTLEEQNKIRKSAMFSLKYNSPFRVGMDVFISIPTTPSKPPWSGVAGVQKLLGTKGFKALIKQEQKHIKAVLNKFLTKESAIIAFQKNAYEGITSENSPQYNLSKAIDGTLNGKYLFDKQIPVYCVAPTRFLNGGQAKKSLRKTIQRVKNIT